MEQMPRKALPDDIDDVLITGQLSRRPARKPDHQAERDALAALGRDMALNPRGVMQSLAELAMTLCGADSAGVSVLEADGEGVVLRWRAAAGAFAGKLHGAMPRAAGPGGTVIDGNEVLLFSGAGRFFPALRGVQPPIYENLLAPWTVQGRAAGTVWVVAHHPHKHFDAEDARLLRQLAYFASAAHQMSAAHDEAEAARQSVQREVEERTRALARSNALLREEIELRVAAEEAAREHHALLDAAMSVETVGVLFFTLEGKIFGANPAFERMSGYSIDELRRLDRLDSFALPEPAGVAARAASAPTRQGRTAPYTREMVRKDGSHWWGVFAPTLLCVSGTGAKWVEFVLDITERKQAEAALRESEERFRALADASPALIYQFDSRGRALYFNQRFAELRGIPAGQVLGSNWHTMVHPDDLPGCFDALGLAVRERRPCQQRLRLRGADGQWHWFESHSVPWYSGTGEHRGQVGIAIDITEAVRAEQALRDADRRKDEFLATLAHELRNPLAPISNAVQLLGQPQGRRRADRLVEVVQRQVKHIVRLVDDLMEVSRITRGTLQLSVAPVNLQEIVQAAVETSQPEIERERHRLTVTLPDEPVVLEADKVRLTQVFANLLNNAARYTEPGGAIELMVRREGQDAVVAVRDTGIGIPGDQLPRVFDMFAQLHRDSARGLGGLGIGLTMVRSLVELHGGSVQVASDGPGRGSQFTVRLPLPAGPTATAAPATQETARAPLSGRRVLIVDDNRDAADSLAMLLEADGARVSVAYDGPHALAVADAFMPHAVLLDLGMPGMDGYEVAQRLQRNPALADTRLIALTGWGQESDRRATSACGFDHHLTKPVDIQALGDLLRQA
jgi:PAS domain S-box-containing protein